MRTVEVDRGDRPLKVSVITVSYNSAATIGDTLCSVASQEYPHIEHVVVDGGSTEDTMKIVAQFPHVARAVSEPDRGIYDAMNKGVAMATGDVIGFLNADDVYADDSVVQRIAACMAEAPLDAIFADVAFFKGDDKQQLLRRYRSDRFTPERIGWGWMPAHPSLYVLRRLFTDVGPFRTDFRIAGDFEWVARAFQDGRLRYRYVPDIFVLMRMGGASTAGWRSTLRLNREVMRACRANDVRTNWLKLLSKYPAKLMEFRPS